MSAPTPPPSSPSGERPAPGGASAAPRPLGPGGSPRVPLLVGLLGSLLVVAGSYSVGWLASVSPLNRWQWLIPWRTDEAGVLTGITLLTLGFWLLFWAWIRLGQTVDPRGGGTVGTMTWASALWSAPLLVALPILSRDMYAYVAQGRMMAAGKNPYEDSISDVSNWLQLGADSMWAYDGTPYGPVFLWVEQAVVNASGGENPDLAIVLFRLVAVLGVVLTAVFVPLLARRTGTPPGWAQWLTTANPLVIIHFVASGHNDALMVGLALAGTWCALRAGRPERPQSALASAGWGLAGVLLVTLSLGVKPITVVLLPFIGLLWAGPRAGWPRRFASWAATAVTSALIMLAVGHANGYGFGWVSVMASTGTGTSPWAPIGMLSSVTIGVLEALGNDVDRSGIEGLYKTAGRLLSVLVVAVLMFRGRQDRILPRMTWAFTALVVLSPVIHPWYLLWLLPFFAVIGIPDDWRLTWVFFTVCFFLTYGAQDQLFTWPFLEIAGEVKVVSLAVSALCLVWILLLDPHTRHVLRGGMPGRHELRTVARSVRRRPEVR